ncbi:MAG: L,D-transpeptidase [Candidatus Kapaibacterium sp.]
MNIRILIIIALLTSAVCACDNGEARDRTRPDEADAVLPHELLDSIRRAEMIASYDTFSNIDYKRHYIPDYNNYLEIKKKYGDPKENRAAWRAFTTLNRKEFRFVRVGDTVIIPDRIHSDLRAYSIFPQFYYDARHLPKIIMVSNKYQCYGAYENGHLVRFAAVNSGKERTPTFPGRYALVWKERVRRSSLDSNWVMPFTWNFHAQAGNAFHQFEMPGRPVSHSCLRQFMEDAEWLYSWGRGVRFDSSGNRQRMSGTPVIILDIFDFRRPKYGPWLDIASNTEKVIEFPRNPMEVEEAIIPLCQIPVDARGGLHDYKRFKYGEDTLRARGIIRQGVVLIETRNFNKLRRQKAELEAKRKKEEEKMRLIEPSEAEQPAGIETNNSEINNDEIKLKNFPSPNTPASGNNPPNGF